MAQMAQIGKGSIPSVFGCGGAVLGPSVRSMVKLPEEDAVERGLFVACPAPAETGNLKLEINRSPGWRNGRRWGLKIPWP